MQLIAVTLKYILKYSISINTLRMDVICYNKKSNYFSPSFLGTFTKKEGKNGKKDNLWKMFRAKIYASPENFTPLLHGIHVTFRKSDFTQALKILQKPGLWCLCYFASLCTYIKTFRLIRPRWWLRETIIFIGNVPMDKFWPSSPNQILNIQV